MRSPITIKDYHRPGIIQTVNKCLPLVETQNCVASSEKLNLLTNLKTLGIVDDIQKAAIEGGSGIIAVASLSDPDEVALAPSPISLLACEQLELLANLAGSQGTSGVIDVMFFAVLAK